MLWVSSKNLGFLAFSADSFLVHSTKIAQKFDPMTKGFLAQNVLEVLINEARKLPELLLNADRQGLFGLDVLPKMPIGIHRHLDC